MVAVNVREIPPCRWRLLFIGQYGAEQPDLAPFEEELRRHSEDPTLCCLSLQPQKFALLLVSSWDGYLRVDARVARGELRQLLGHALERSEPVITEAFIDRFCREKPDPTLVRIFARCYGPIFEKAVSVVFRNARESKYQYDDLLGEVWLDFLKRPRYILSHFSEEIGTPEAFLFRVVKNSALDVLRGEIRREYIVVSSKEDKPEAKSEGRADDAAAKSPASTKSEAPTRRRRYLWIDDPNLKDSSLGGGALDRTFNDISVHELEALFEKFKQSCDKGRGPAEKELWPFFVDAYIEGLSTEELERKYKLKQAAVHQRRHRIRERLQHIWQTLDEE